MATMIHVAPKLLKQFTDGRSPQDDILSILQHLAECDYCLEIAHAFWVAQPANNDIEPSVRTAERLRMQIIERVKQMNLPH